MNKKRTESDSEISDSSDSDDEYYREKDASVKGLGDKFLSTNPALYDFKRTNRKKAKGYDLKRYGQDFFEKKEYLCDMNIYQMGIYNNEIHSEDMVEDDAKYYVKYIYHLSNILIKSSGSCKKDFELLFKKLKDVKKKEGVIVITGGLLNYGKDDNRYEIAVYVLTNLCKIMPTILLNEKDNYLDYEVMCNEQPKGGFDEDGEYKSELDKIKCKMMYNPNFYYVCGPGLFDFYNITFSVSSFWSRVIQQEDMGYKKVELRKYLVGLHFGEITTAIEVNKDHSYSPDLFKGYDYVLLGGCDRFQFVRKNMWYVGSLLQHDKNEVMNIHGFIELDLESDVVKFIELKV